MPISTTLPRSLRRSREKVFGCPAGGYLDGNAKAKILVIARAWSARLKRKGQHRGPLTRAFEDVLKVLLYKFNQNAKGLVYPSLEKIACAARCHADTVVEALKVLEMAGVLTWVNRIKRERYRVCDLLGGISYAWRVVRTSNAYIFANPCAALAAKLQELPLFSSYTENPSGSQNQDTILSCGSGNKYKLDPDDALDRQLLSLFATITDRSLVKTA